MLAAAQSTRLLAAGRALPTQQRSGRRLVTTAAGRQFRTIREDVDRARLKKQGVIKTVKSAPQKQQAADGSGEGPNVALIAAGVLVPLALWLVLGSSQ